MKQVQLHVYVLLIHSDDGDTYTTLFAKREDAIEYLYNEVSENWGDTFDEDNIDDYTDEEAVDHYYEYGNSVGWYSLNLESVELPLIDLQDRIAKAIGLATHG